MKKLLNTKLNGKKGFTLIELLVVIGILGALAAIAVPAYSAFFGSGESEANETELTNVQSAMDAMMAAQQIGTVTAETTGTATFVALPAGTGAIALSPTYLRTNPPKCEYTWIASGQVSQVGGSCS